MVCNLKVVVLCDRHDDHPLIVVIFYTADH